MAKTYTVKSRRTDTGYGTEPYTKQNGVGSVIPQYGELVYNNRDKTLQIGDNVSTKLQDLKILKLLDRARALVLAFINKNALSGDDWKGDLVTIEDENSNKLFSRTKFWTMPGANGVPVDKNGNTIQFSATPAGKWWKVDTSTGKISSTSVSGTPTQFPVAQKIAIEGIKSTDRVQVSLALSDSDRKSVSTIKAKEKVFATFCDVESYDGGIYIVVKKLVTDGNCYLNVFGG